MRRNRLWTGIFFAVVALTLVSAATLDRLSNYSPFDKRHYLTSEQIAFVRPGLQLEVQDVAIADDGTVQVTFTLADDRGLPLDLDGVFTPGPIRARFILASIPAESNQWVAYTTRVQTSPITGDSALQPTNGGGSFEEIADGTYIFTFDFRLPAGYDRTATHGVGIYSDRDLSEFGLERQVDNDVIEFVPDGSEVLKVRDVVRTTACNQCHDPLALHGGVRRATQLCVMCHNDGVIDPDTGNTVDMKVMIHKIHRGEDLPSVQDGTPYQIIGFRQSVHDYSEVVFPQDVRNCDSCHDPDATQSMAYILRPTRAACGSCHDDVNFATGENHPGGPALSDNFCANCHFPEGEFEFDASVIGAHTIPANSRQLEGINIEFTDVTGTGPGESPTVFFTLKNNAGESIDPASMRSLNLRLAGPSDDYSFLASESAVEGSVPAGEGFMYSFTAAIPDDAEGSFAVAAESTRNVLLNAGTVEEFTHREASDNPVFYFGVTDAEPFARRVNVMDQKCESCHKDLALHGSQRHNATAYCQMCHQTAADDSRFREEGTPRTIDFKFLIHRIHRGEELTRDYTVLGFRGTPHNYNNLLFPGDLRNCAKCHENDSYEIPSQGILPTLDGNEFFSPIAPNAAACLGCHDSAAAAAHAFLNIAPFAEACAACHGPNSEFSVARVHSR